MVERQDARNYAMQVLLIEDDPQFVYLIERYASSSGCSLVRLATGDREKLLALQERPDLILFDIGLDSERGWQFLQECKSSLVTYMAPVYICSANDQAVLGWEERVDGCLMKPVMFEDFVHVLTKINPSLETTEM